MDVVRITELQPKTYVEQGDYIAIDNQSDGTKKVQFTNLLDDTLSQENKIAPANVVGDEIATIRAAVGSPLKASTVAQMTDTNKIYVYVGSESGYTNGNWYYWNGSAWTSGGVYNSVAVVTDPTLTLSGVPADAKATGDEVTNLKAELNEISDTTDNIFDMSVFEGVTGITKDLNGYYTGTATAFSDAFSAGVPGLVFDPDSKYYLSLHGYTDGNSYVDTSNGLIIRLYDADSNQLVRINLKNDALSDAKYEAISSAGSVATMRIGKSSNAANIWHIKDIMLIKSDVAVDYYPHKTAFDRTARNMVNESDAEISIAKNYIKSDLDGGQSIFFEPSEIEIGNIKNIGGVDEASDTIARTSGYIKLAHPENTYVWNLNGYYVGIFEYYKKADGTFAYIDYRYLILNSGIYVPSLGTTHIRLRFQKQNSDYITDGIIKTICDNFIMREGREVNKYLKVCSFNMARLYATLSGADAEGLQKQIWNYLEFIGNFNPDVIQAQEAGGNYWYWDDNHTLNMNTTVFDRKYPFKVLPTAGQKTWSQYNFSETEAIEFTDQASGEGARYYSRSYLHFEGKDICILNTHCTFRGEFTDARQGQFQELATEMAQHEYCILCGDFNAADVSEFEEFNAFNMANCGDYGVIDTWFIGGTSEWENHAIDNIITTKNILIQNVEIGKYDMDFFSDHVPIVATLKIIDIDSTTV